MDKYIEEWKRIAAQGGRQPIDDVSANDEKSDVPEVPPPSVSLICATQSEEISAATNPEKYQQTTINLYTSLLSSSRPHGANIRQFYLERFRRYKKLNVLVTDNLLDNIPAKQSTVLEFHPWHANDLLIGTPKSLSYIDMNKFLHHSHTNQVHPHQHVKLGDDPGLDRCRKQFRPSWQYNAATKHTIDCARWIPWHQGRIIIADRHRNGLLMYDITHSNINAVQHFQTTDLQAKTVRDIAFFPDNRFVDAAYDGQLRFWDVRENSHAPYRIMRGQHQHHAIHSVNVASNGYAMMTACTRGIIQLWDTRRMANIVKELNIASLLPGKTINSLTFRQMTVNPENEGQIAFQTSSFAGSVDIHNNQLLHIVQQAPILEEKSGPEVPATSGHPRPVLGLRVMNESTTMPVRGTVTHSSIDLAKLCWIPHSVMVLQREAASCDIRFVDFSATKPILTSSMVPASIDSGGHHHIPLALAHHDATHSLIMQTSNYQLPHLIQFSMEEDEDEDEVTK